MGLFACPVLDFWNGKVYTWSIKNQGVEIIMKYNININQRVLKESNLDILDCAILDWLVVICNSNNESISQHRIDGMTWIDYKKLISDMPLLRITTTGAITPRIRKIEKEGYIKTQTIYGKGHQRMFVGLERKIDQLFMEMNNKQELFTKLNSTVHETKQLSEITVHETKPIIILDTIHNNTSISILSDKSDPAVLIDGFDKFWEAYPKKEKKKGAESIWKQKKLASKLPEILEFISKAKNTMRWKQGYIKQPTTFLNGECWNDELASYGGAIAAPASQSLQADRPADYYSKKSIKLE